jgi:hypothetical protein
VIDALEFKQFLVQPLQIGRRHDLTASDPGSMDATPFWSSLRLVGERSPASCGDPHPRDFDRASGNNHAPAVCGREPVAHQLNHLRDGEAVCAHKGLGAPVAGSGKQFERAAAVGLGTAGAAWRGVRALPHASIIPQPNRASSLG